MTDSCQNGKKFALKTQEQLSAITDNLQKKHLLEGHVIMLEYGRGFLLYDKRGMKRACLECDLYAYYFQSCMDSHVNACITMLFPCMIFVLSDAQVMCHFLTPRKLTETHIFSYSIPCTVNSYPLLTDVVCI